MSEEGGIVKLKVGEQETVLKLKKEGKMKILELPVKIEVAKDSFLHIGASPSPLTEKKGSVFKVDRKPVIPATSFKGALRHQLELLFIEKLDKLAELFNMTTEDKKGLLKPCIPSPKPSKAEKELIQTGRYREKHCELRVEDERVTIPALGNKEKIIGICPVCYFMGCAGLMGFLRFGNFFPKGEGSIIDQTNIRIDRKTGTAAHGAMVMGEQVKPGIVFKGSIDVVISDPLLLMQGTQFGDPRRIGELIIDKWLENWKETDKDRRVNILIEEILIPAIQSIKDLGGQKSRGAGKVNVNIDFATSN